MKNLNGYKIIATLFTLADRSILYKAQKGNSEYLLKRLASPRRPSDRISESLRKRRNDECDLFFEERKKLLTALRLQGSHFYSPIDFFEHDGYFYESYDARESTTIDAQQVSAFPYREKEMLLQTATQYLRILHNIGIIHFDVKPANLPVSINVINGRLVCTLINFDSARFENTIPAPELIDVTDAYMSPELAAYKMNNSKYGNKVTAKNDIFALAIVFHEYWTGRKFIYNGSENTLNKRHLYQTVDNNEPITMALGIPRWLEALLRWMIKKNPADRPSISEVLEAIKDHSKIPGLVHEFALRPESELQSIVERKLISERKTILGTYVKGPNFPNDAVFFKKLANGNIKLIYKNGSRMVYRHAVAIRKGIVRKT